MSSRRKFWAALGCVFLAVGSVSLRADVTVRLSVKFILNTNGAYPVGGIGSNVSFQAEVDRGNAVLAATGRGYRLQVIEYLPISPPPPSGQPANFWYTNTARANRQAMESASIANPTAWRRNVSGALNLYVNNSASGQCSLLGTGDSISLGATIVTGTVLHEIGHFFDLSHTHAGDPSCVDFSPPTPLSSGLSNGDRLDETIPDHPCYTQDQLSIANFGSNYVLLLPAQKAAVDRSFLNVMSYHQEDQLLEIQMDYWTFNANHARQTVCTGHIWFVALNGIDTYSPFLSWDGLGSGTPFRTPDYALNLVPGDVNRTRDDVILFRAGTYTTSQNLATPCTLRATRGVVTITR